MANSRLSLDSLSSPSPSPAPSPTKNNSKAKAGGGAAGLGSDSELSELTDDEQEVVVRPPPKTRQSHQKRSSAKGKSKVLENTSHQEQEEEEEEGEEEEEQPARRESARRKAGGSSSLVPAGMWDWAAKKSNTKSRQQVEEEQEEQGSPLPPKPTQHLQDEEEEEEEQQQQQQQRVEQELVPVTSKQNDSQTSEDEDFTPTKDQEEDEDEQEQEQEEDGPSPESEDEDESILPQTVNPPLAQDAVLPTDVTSRAASPTPSATSSVSQRHSPSSSRAPSPAPIGDNIQQQPATETASLLPTLAQITDPALTVEQTPDLDPDQSMDDVPREDPLLPDPSHPKLEEEEEEEEELIEEDEERELSRQRDIEMMEEADLDEDEEEESLESDLQPAHRADALDALAAIELKFALLREQIYLEKMEGLAWEETLVGQGTHPELIHLQEELHSRRNKRLELASRKRGYEVANVTKRRRVDEDATWAWWKLARDDLQTEMISETNKRRRKLERDRRTIERPQPQRRIPPPPRDIPIPPSLHYIVTSQPFSQSGGTGMNEQSISNSRKRATASLLDATAAAATTPAIPPLAPKVYPELATLALADVHADMDFLYQHRNRMYQEQQQQLLHHQQQQQFHLEAQKQHRIAEPMQSQQARVVGMGMGPPALHPHSQPYEVYDPRVVPVNPNRINNMMGMGPPPLPPPSASVSSQNNPPQNLNANNNPNVFNRQFADEVMGILPRPALPVPSPQQHIHYGGAPTRRSISPKPQQWNGIPRPSDHDREQRERDREREEDVQRQRNHREQRERERDLPMDVDIQSQQYKHSQQPRASSISGGGGMAPHHHHRVPNTSGQPLPFPHHHIHRHAHPDRHQIHNNDAVAGMIVKNDTTTAEFTNTGRKYVNRDVPSSSSPTDGDRPRAMPFVLPQSSSVGIGNASPRGGSGQHPNTAPNTWGIQSMLGKPEVLRR